jgi:hypothetical protein
LNPRPKVYETFAEKESNTASLSLRSPQELKLFCGWLESQGKTQWTVKQTKNYATRYMQILQPGQDYKDKILEAVNGLKQEIER